MTTPPRSRSALLDFYTNAPLLELGGEADRVRRERHPRGIVTYIVDRNINYTNVCVADCGFCAFFRRPKHHEGWTLSFEEIGAKIEETKALGGVQILMQGGHNPYIPFEWYLWICCDTSSNTIRFTFTGSVRAK
jgi:cyclic dehypoxanthinyl futalosine synthase